jgi:hypothetical protein
MPRTRTVFTTAVAALTLFGCTVATATAAADPSEPPRHLAKLVRGGADGRPHEAFCPAMQHVLSGGFTISAASGARLSRDPADIIESRSNDDANGWYVAVRKPQLWRIRHYAGAADLTIHLVCTDDTMTHGA